VASRDAPWQRITAARRLDDHRSERFSCAVPWEDPEGLLALSPKQRKYFGGWARPSEFVPTGKPTMIAAISPFSITQDLVTDCSFVASLVITSHFERRFRKQLITSIIYPQVCATSRLARRCHVLGGRTAPASPCTTRRASIW
jgi:hypothetical protein